jgi:hypothetical protein
MKDTDKFGIKNLEEKNESLDNLKFEIADINKSWHGYEVDYLGNEIEKKPEELRIIFNCERNINVTRDKRGDIMFEHGSVVHSFPDLFKDRNSMQELCDKLNNAITPIIKPYIDNLKKMLCEELKEYMNEVCKNVQNEMEDIKCKED